MDRETGKPRGFAHVQFDGVEGAAAAIAKKGTELMGRGLFIDSAQERPQSGATPGGRQQRGTHPCTSVDHVHVASRIVCHMPACCRLFAMITLAVQAMPVHLAARGVFVLAITQHSWSVCSLSL